MTLGSTQLL